MTKLLIVTTIPVTLYGFLAPFVNHFRAQGWQVDGMAEGITTSDPCCAILDRVWDIQWSRNPLDPLNLLVAPRQIRAIVAQEQYDLIHVHTPVAAFVTRYALRSTQNPKIIYTTHGFHFYQGGDPWKNAIFLRLEKLAGAWTDYLVVINREDELAAQQHQIVPVDRLRYMPGIGIDRSIYTTKAIAPTQVAQVRQQLELPADVPLLLAIAEFIPRKRHRDLLQAFAQINHPTACLLLAGVGPLLQEMMQLALKLGLEKRVRFLGFCYNIPLLIQAAAATILVSQQEGLPRSVMESMALATPVIGTDIRGIRDLLAVDCGLLVHVGAITALAEAIDWILDHPEAAAQMGKQGSDRLAQYDLQHIIQLHQELYAEALGDKQVVFA